MKYSLFWSDRADKELGKLSSTIAQRISDKLELIRDNPYRTVEWCTGYPYFHQRIGAYRVILDIDNTALSIRVHSVGIRKKVYDR
jgi:mRNA-degrading endonuclease RelE of RelBE toxin-antitoxin system